ncbi:MAG: hypothetical protein ACYDAY_01910 [Candidatus Dormibacteria bacterium]
MRAAGTRLQPWATAMLAGGSGSLLVALMGLTWDVAYHIDHGRDAQLFSGAHVMILAGLAGLGLTALTAILLATRQQWKGGFRAGPLRVPWTALTLGSLSASAMSGFPVDDLWHRTYGIDVTMWSPTHLVMISAAVLSTLALALVPAEAGIGSDTALSAWLRLRRVTLFGAVLLGLTALQLEFDFGVPQWPAVYQPMLVAVTAGVGLVGARAALGRGGAIRAVIFYIAVRLGLFAFVSTLGLQPPRFPLYVGAAVAVELVFLLGSRWRPLTRALASGLAIATLGLGAEWAVSQVWFVHPWQPVLLASALMPVCAALAASVLGVALGHVASRLPTEIPRAVLPAAALGLVAALLLPLPRTSIPATAVLTTTVPGPAAPAVDRDGMPSFTQSVNLTVTVSPAAVAQGADIFEVMAWQGGGQRNIPLVETAPGTYHNLIPVPTGGTWKTMVFLSRGSLMMAAPISFPADSAYGDAGVRVTPRVVRQMVPASRLLTSEAHNGPPLVASGAFALLAVVLTLGFGLIGLSYFQVNRRRPVVARA